MSSKITDRAVRPTGLVVSNSPHPRHPDAAFANHPPTRRPLSILLSLTAEFCPPDDARDKLALFHASIVVEAGR
jgi:hypothetical protein